MRGLVTLLRSDLAEFKTERKSPVTPGLAPAVSEPLVRKYLPGRRMHFQECRGAGSNPRCLDQVDSGSVSECAE